MKKKETTGKNKRKVSIASPLSVIKKLHTTSLPASLEKRFRESVILAVIVIIAGLFMLPIIGSFKGAIFPVTMGLFVYVFGASYKWSIIKNGYTEIEGICSEQARLIPLGKGADGFRLQTNQGEIYVPTTKRGNTPPVGSTVKVYVPANETGSEHKDTLFYSRIYGYEILMD